MPFKSKFSKLFAKVEYSNKLGIAFRKDALSYFYQSADGTCKTHQFPIEQGSYLPALKALAEKESIKAQVQLVLSAEQYQIVQVDKPSIPDEEIHAALKWQIKDLVTVEPEDMIIDYFSGLTLAGGKEKINVVCAKKSELSTILSTLSHSELAIDSIITEEFAFAGLVAFKAQPVLLIVQQPNEEVHILIVKESNIYFHRRLRGFAQLGSKTPEELGFGTIDSLSLEVQRSMDYYERQLKQAPIREIELVLPVKTEAYIATKLAENTAATVSVLDIDENILANKAMAAAYGAVRGTLPESEAK